ncbi:MAG: leucyl aminopeptidase family protein [Nitrosomonadales bacterium]|jgi:leucyl aminopeptidase|nr:leucyl aminopeptidase family protein [Nitrosomonadales bacterium]MBT4760039.1 leucyl aminopeptidase family protein [Nitrosomonadales bacterium]MBT7482181.1 leucyl aminopeptidase family protein [Nitrosomonadales bacterium]
MNIKISQNSKIPSEPNLRKHLHALILFDEKQLKPLFMAALKAKLQRQGKKIAELKEIASSAELENGSLVTWVMISDNKSVFQIQTILRKSFEKILSENPKSITIINQSKKNDEWIKQAVYVASVNSQDLPNLKSGAKRKNLKLINVLGASAKTSFKDIEALVAGNTLTRELTITPPNQLTPTIYRQKIKKLSKDNGWKVEEFTMPKLKKIGAGAFYAVAQGSEPQDAAIVHLTYAPRGAKETISLVGKGICFDTGGHNLKPAKFMSGMHEDMNGSAVVLGILKAISDAKVKVKLDCWLAIAQNHIGPKAYKQNDVVKALNGMTIEIVHTDAEGRMVLADTLTMASRKKPKVIIDFATLTGCMHVAMGDRYSGVLSNHSALGSMAVGAGSDVGERVTAFPSDEDYEEDLKSQIADIKQCTLEGGPDHIHATRFLGRFINNNVPWLHMDLSSSNRKGGLGAVASEVNGFGVSFGVNMIEKLMKKNL